MASDRPEAIRIVLGPDVLASSFFDPASKTVLDHWRNGVVRLIVTRELLMTYLSVLRGLGLSDAQLRRWAMWFTSRDAAEANMGSDGSGGTVPAMLARAASGGTRFVVVNRAAWRDALSREAAAVDAATFIRELTR
ncbi:MAG: hypothetical protein RBU21_01255 [FCB group bacterium]|nr:hypothetical protein [FCB group bacterium]